MTKIEISKEELYYNKLTVAQKRQYISELKNSINVHRNNMVDCFENKMFVEAEIHDINQFNQENVLKTLVSEVLYNDFISEYSFMII